MKITKRDGHSEQLSFDKIIYRLRKLCNDKSLGVLENIDPDIVAQRVVSSIYDGVTSRELDEEAARIAVSMTDNLEYQKLASRIIISNLHKSTNECFSEVMEKLYNNVDKQGKHTPVIADDVMDIIRLNKNTLNFVIDYNRDYLFDYFGYKTLEKSYLLRMFDKEKNTMCVVERPQHLYMRVAVGIHKNDIPSVLETYELISQHYYTHASPTMFNSGTRLANLSSCFLLGTHDSIEGIYKTITDCGRISKLGGGIGVHISNIRAKGSIIRGTNGISDGIIPMLKVYNSTAAYINQSGKRKGSFACFVTDTKVCTVNEGIKNIQDVKIGDEVVTHKNRVRPVTQIHKNTLGDRKIYKVSVEGSKDIYVTGNHKLWSYYTKKNKKDKLSYGWNSVEELKSYIENKNTTRQSCYVAMPEGTGIENTQQYVINVLTYKDNILNHKVREIKEIDHDKICPISYCIDTNGYEKKAMGQIVNKTWVIDDDLANLFGIWLGDGSIKRYQDYINGIEFTVNSENLKLINYITNVCESVFGCKVTMSNPKASKVTLISVNSQIIGTVFDKLFCSYFDGKILPSMVFSWPKKLIINLLAGLITTYGHVAKRKKTDITLLRFSNEYLVTQIYHLCRNNGIKATYLNPHFGHHTISISKSRELVSRLLKVYNDDRMERCFNNINISENDRYLKISSITETGRHDEFVYTLGVEEDHSYTVEGLLVENCYIEPWHADVMDFLDLKKNQGHDDVRARDLFYAMWTPDLFMKQVECDGDWYLMCPDECPGLTETYGEDFERLYWQYVSEKRFRRVVKAQEVWKKIMDSQIETGVPYIGYKDAVNKKCNQKNLGTIKSSNLCMEISLYSDDKNYAVCNLASVALPKYVEFDDNNQPYFNFDKLHKVAKYIVHPMNKVIDNNYYPTTETFTSNMAHRPLGIGIQGLADVYFKMRLPFESDAAMKLNKEIFETLYHGTLEGSIEQAKNDGSYDSFAGSPYSQGKLQFDLAHEYDGINLKDYITGRWDWDKLKADMEQYGARNSMLIALMPTASSAQIMGNTESFEPIDSCIFKRRVLSGEYMVVNKYLVAELSKLGLWNKTMKERIIALDGSIQSIPEIPDDIKAIYKTVWEISMKKVIEQCRDRGVFVDQMQSMNLFMANPNYRKLTSMHFYAWKASLKSGMYYLRSKAVSAAGKFSIDAALEKNIRAKQENGESLDSSEQAILCSIDNKEACLMCSS